VEVPALDISVVGQVPAGGGLSSSASLEVSVAFLLDSLLGRKTDPAKLALICQEAEHKFANVPCGIMDQYISAMGRENAAILIDCRNLEKSEFVPVNKSDAVFLVISKVRNSIILMSIDTNVKHELGNSEYSKRRKECNEAVDALKQVLPSIKALRDASLSDLSLVEKSIPDVVRRRAHHVISENNRTCAFAEAFKRGDLKTCGQLMVESHESLRKDYEVSCDELNFVVDTALTLKGVYGARMTGGGFGGSAVALVAVQQVEEIQNTILSAYRERFAINCSFLVTRPSRGALIH
jgi:galactokinase